jgi:prepilin-type N-terminal cleavage/methylation domain-containing protein
VYRKGLSLVEIIIAVAILGLLAALALPRLTRASERPGPDETLRDRLQLLRCAIERYHQEHGVYPAARGDGTHPPGSAEAFHSQLTMYTNVAGEVSAVFDTEHRLGPYLPDGVPANPLSDVDGGRRVRVFGRSTGPDREAAAADGGWIYNCDSGLVIPSRPAGAFRMRRDVAY